MCASDAPTVGLVGSGKELPNSKQFGGPIFQHFLLASINISMHKIDFH